MIHDFNVVVIDGGAADLGVVPGSKLAVMLSLIHICWKIGGT